MQASDSVRPAVAEGYLYYRHALPVRIMHWINVIALTVLLMSGLNIFSAHPSLYWGKSSYSDRPAIFEIDEISIDARVPPLVGVPAVDTELSRAARAAGRRPGLAFGELRILGKGEFDHDQ